MAATLSSDNYEVGAASTQLVHTASAAGEYVTIVLLAGLALSIGWYNSAGSVLHGADVVCPSKQSAVVGPLNSGDKVYVATDAIVTARVEIGHIGF
jgi:hypothetical protein